MILICSERWKKEEESEGGGIAEGFLVGFASLTHSIPSQCSDNTNSKCVAAFPSSPAASATYSSPIPPIPCGQFQYFLSYTLPTPPLAVSPPPLSPETTTSPSAARCGSTTSATPIPTTRGGDALLLGTPRRTRTTFFTRHCGIGK